MKQKLLNHQKINERKNKAMPIAYSNVSVNELGQLQERSQLLDQRVVEGYGCIWGSINSHGEMFVKGSFAKSITENGPGSNAKYELKFRDEHGRACALFEVLKEDEIGLYFRTKPLDNVQWANDLLVQLRSGTINNFSNGFKYIWDKVEWDDENDCLVMLEARLYEISAVAIPSDMETFAIRSIEEAEYVTEDTEEFIDSLPKSKQLECRKIIARNISLAQQVEPSEIKGRTLKKAEIKPKKSSIDYKYLSQNLKN